MADRHPCHAGPRSRNRLTGRAVDHHHYLRRSRDQPSARHGAGRRRWGRGRRAGGGILTSGLNWRWVLFVNVPIGLAAAALAPRTLIESRADDDTDTFDLPGAVTVTAGLSLLVYAIVNAVNVGWGSSETLLLIAAAFVLLIAFVLIESGSGSR